MTQEKKKRIIVVLGMHRSGTSAVTRGLKVMGVELGNRLMLPTRFNPKGYWEDMDICRLNDEMLAAIGSDWFHVTALGKDDVEVLCKKGYFLRAVELLRQKVGSTSVFGLKDPRVAKLLPFWKKVFKNFGSNVYYVFVVRHPLSVAQSLTNCEGFDSKLSYLMWLSYVVTSILETVGETFVLVDYDRLMQSPESELGRIARTIYLEINPKELQIYKNEFLDHTLRHTVYDLNDLLLDDDCPPIVHEIYTVLLDLASEKKGVDIIELQKKSLSWADEFGRLQSTLTFIDRLFSQKELANKAIAEHGSQIAEYNQIVAKRDEQIETLKQAVAERDVEIDNINRIVADLTIHIRNIEADWSARGKHIESLEQIIADQTTHIRNIEADWSARGKHIESLEKLIADQTTHIRNIEADWSARGKHIESLEKLIADQTRHINNIEAELIKYNQSWYGRLKSAIQNIDRFITSR
jgi:O-antigen biosynthesis protein